ncbi:MAG: presenilin family intramembrane aspartyl protease [Candidatus Micrarchaeaceae archaeon]
MQERRIEYRQLVYILVLFILVQLAGLLVVFYFIPPGQIYSAISQVPSTSAVAGLEQVLEFIIYIVFGTIILLLIFRFYHGIKIYAIIEGIVVVSASFYLFAIILGSIFASQADTYYVIAVSLAVPVLLLFAKHKKPWLRNELAIIASIGAGVVLGLVFPFAIAFVFMLAIAAYDYIAVFITKHMLALGRQAMDQNMALLISSSDVELVPKEYLSKKSLESFRKSFKVSSIHNRQLRNIVKQGAVPIPTQAALGTGDLAVPLMLAVSAYTAYANYFMASVIVAGATLGLVFTMYILKNYKIALPAIPPLFSFVSMVLGAAYAIKGAYVLALALFVLGVVIIALMLYTVRKVAGQSGRSVF